LIKHDNVKITRKGGAGLQRDNNLAGKIQREWTLDVLGIHDLFGTELAMIFSFPVGLTDSVMQRMQLFSFCQCLFDIFLLPHCQIYYFNIRKKVNDLLSV
jgi:hypothetical protein